MKLSRLITAVVAGVALFALLPSCAQTADISDVWMSIDGDGSRRRSEVFTDTEEIYCIAEYGNGRDDVTIELIVRALQIYSPSAGGVVDRNFVAAYHEEKPAKTTEGRPGRATVKLVAVDDTGEPSEDAPFTVGRYQCEAYLDGELKGTAVYNVRFPPCPTRAIAQNQKCLFYGNGTVCSINGNTGDPQPTCTCINGVWQC